MTNPPGKTRRLFLQIWVLFLEECRDIFGRRRAVFSLILHLFFICLLLFALSKVQDRVQDAMQQVNMSPEQEQYMTEELIRQIELVVPGISKLRDWPLIISLFQFISLLWLPSLVALISCDVVAIDIYRGTLRFITLRASRLSYYVSKVIAHVLLFVLLQLVAVTLLLILCAINVEDFSLTAYLDPTIRYLVVYLPFVVMVVALTTWVSSWCNKPINALILLHVVWFAMVLLAAQQPEITPIYHVITRGLLLPVGTEMGTAILGQLAWAAGFLTFGILGFTRRSI